MYQKVMIAAILIGAVTSATCAEGAAGDDLTLWYRRPAQKWLEAVPLGNGRLGAMVFGGIDSERIQLNVDTLWAGPPVPEDRVGGFLRREAW